MKRMHVVGAAVVPGKLGDAGERFLALLDGIGLGRSVLSGEMGAKEECNEELDAPTAGDCEVLSTKY
jgi:hypothetical protein